MAAYRQFIAYRLVPDVNRPGKTHKFPVDPATGAVADAHDPRIWTDFATAAACGKGNGVGFVFTASDPFWFVDIDDALVDGQWNDAANLLCTELAGAAVEVSQSGRGLHIFGTGPVPPHGCDNLALHTQFYTERRFVALTGMHAYGDAGFAPPRLAEVITQHFPVIGGGKGAEAGWWSSEPVPEWRGPTNDDDLLRRALRSTSAAAVFGDKANFADLWNADGEKLGKRWPADKPGELYNASIADAALAQHLAFWTGNDAERIERLMRKSMLIRPKWDTRDDYLQNTIRNACAMQTAWLVDAPPPPPPVQAQGPTAANQPTAATPVESGTYLSPDEQVAYFAGCVYIQDQHRVLLPNGNVVKDSQFKVIYGGRNFVIDRANTRTVRNAFEAFTESQAYRFPRAETTCFRPQLPTGEIVVEGGLSRVNTYAPVSVPRAFGDTSRFWNHLAKLFPDETDRLQIVSYLAACVQHQGIKFQWAPLIQGVGGNGKTMLALFAQAAIGKRYVEWPKAGALGNDFNAWLEGKVFYAVDEIYVEDKRRDVLETLKPMITSDDGIQVTKKGVDSVSRDICGNFLFLTNHRDGLRKARSDRRIAPYFTPQQTVEDLVRDGLTEAYFADLVDWLKGRRAYKGQERGYAIIAELLWTWPIPPEHDPRFHVRAPQTSTTELAISEGHGSIEQNILEAIEQNEVGFRGGWVSGAAIKRVLDSLQYRLPPNKHREMMRGLGYDWHPALPQGRPNNDVMPDNCRPKLYLKADHPARALTVPNDVVIAYTTAQGIGR